MKMKHFLFYNSFSKVKSPISSNIVENKLPLKIKKKTLRTNDWHWNNDGKKKKKKNYKAMEFMT